MMQTARVDNQSPSGKQETAEAQHEGEAADTCVSSRCRWRLLLVGIFLSAFVFCAHGLFRSLVRQTVRDQVSQMHLQPTLIFLDAPEDQEHAFVRVDALVHGGESQPHHIKLSDSVCSVLTGSGAVVFRMHVGQVSHTEASKVHFNMRLEHGAIQDARAELEASEGQPLVECEVGMVVNLFRTGWTTSTRHPVSFAFDLFDRPKLRLVREAARATPPTLSNYTVTAEASYRLEVGMSPSQAQYFLNYIQGAQVHIRGAATYREEDVGSVEASVAVDGELQHWLEEKLDSDPRAVFALPLQAHGHTDLAALAASAAAFTAGEEAELEGREGVRHYRVRPTKDGHAHHGKRHAVAMTATSPRSPLARALGVEHVLSLEGDQDGPTLPESIAHGRKLLERKLTGATLEGYAVRLGLRLFVDDSFASRVDLSVSGGNLANPAVEIMAGAVLRVALDNHTNLPDWHYQAVGVAVIARLLIDVDTPRFSVDLAEKLVVDSTKVMLNGTESRQQGNTVFDGATWEHDVVEQTASVFVSLDGATSKASGGGHFDLTTAEHLLIGIKNFVHTFTSNSNNPSADYDPLTEPALTLPPRRLLEALAPEATRLLEAVGTASQALKQHMPGIFDHLDGAARRLSDLSYIEIPRSVKNNVTVRVNGSVDLDGLGNGNVFDAFLKLYLGGRQSDTAPFGLGVDLTFSTTETQANNYTHDARVLVEHHSGFDFVQPLVTSLANLSQVDSQYFNQVVETNMNIVATAQVVTDLTLSDTAMVLVSVSILPTCGVAPGQDAKVQAMSGYGVTLSLTDPQCQRCEDGPSDDSSSWKGWDTRQNGGATQLLSHCGSSWGGSWWYPSQSCCTFGDSAMRSLFNMTNLTMGIPWTQHLNMSNITRPADDMDVLAWFSASDIELGNGMSRVNVTSVTHGATMTRNWTVDGGYLLVDEITKPTGGVVYHANLTMNNSQVVGLVIDTTNTTSSWGVIFLLDVADNPNVSTDARIEILDRSAGAVMRHDMDATLSLGGRRLLGAVGYLSNSTTSSLIGVSNLAGHLLMSAADVDILNATLTVTDGVGLSGDMDLWLVDPNTTHQLSHFNMVVLEESLLTSCAATLYGRNNTDKVGSVQAEARRQSDGLVHSALVDVKDKSDTVTLGLTGSWTKDANSGTLLAEGRNASGAVGLSASGTLPRVGSFFVGEVGLTSNGNTSLFWVNASDGYVPSGSKNGVDGFTRAILHVGTEAGGAILNLTTYLEDPPTGDDISGLGVGLSMTTPTLSIVTTIDVDLPFMLPGSNDGNTWVQEVVQEVTTEVVMADVTTFDPDVYVAQMAAASDLSVADVIITSLTYVVDVIYTFAEAITELDAIKAVATANNVPESQVSVVITNARRLRAADRRLQTVDVAATIKTADSAAVSAIKTTSQDITAIAQAVQQVAGKTVNPQVKTAPVSKVEVATQLRTDSAPTITPAEITAMGTALGGQVTLGEIKATTRFVPVPSPPSGSAGAAVQTATPAMGPVLFSLLAAVLLQ